MKKLILSVATVVSLGLFVGCTDTIVSDQISNNSDTLSFDGGIKPTFDDFGYNACREIAWVKQNGLALDVGIGNYTAWRIARSGVYQYVGTTEESSGWMQTKTGSGYRIDVDGYGTPWIIDLNNKIYRYNGNTWDQKPGAARDIGAGDDGTIWVIGTDRRNGGYGIHRLKESGNGWERISGAAVRIDVDSVGNAWVVNDQGVIYHYNGTSWDKLSGPQATDIGVSASGSIWIVDSNGSPWSYYPQIDEWIRHSGYLNNITVDDNGSPWGTNIYGSYYAVERSKVFDYWR